MSTKSNNDCSLCQKIGLRPFTKDNVLFYYMPMHSMVCYGALAVNVMNPGLAARLIPNRDITNVLLLSTLFGTTLYISNKPHLKELPLQKKATYGVLGSSLFGLGSILVWAIIRSVAPKNNTALTTALGLGSGALIVKVGTDYLGHCDQLVKKN